MVVNYCGTKEYNVKFDRLFLLELIDLGDCGLLREAPWRKQSICGKSRKVTL